MNYLLSIDKSFVSNNTIQELPHKQDMYNKFYYLTDKFVVAVFSSYFNFSVTKKQT